MRARGCKRLTRDLGGQQQQPHEAGGGGGGGGGRKHVTKREEGFICCYFSRLCVLNTHSYSLLTCTLYSLLLAINLCTLFSTYSYSLGYSISFTHSLAFSNSISDFRRDFPLASQKSPVQKLHQIGTLKLCRFEFKKTNC